MVDTSAILAQPLLLKASHSPAQILCVVYGHLKLSDLINHRLEVAETGDGPADFSIEHGYVLSSAPKQEGRFDLIETNSGAPLVSAPSLCGELILTCGPEAGG
jgi:hypothetical protein